MGVHADLCHQPSLLNSDLISVTLPRFFGSRKYLILSEKFDPASKRIKIYLCRIKEKKAMAARFGDEDKPQLMSAGNHIAQIVYLRVLIFAFFAI